ncbi:MAG: hypothetical protein ACOH18_04300 [Candidatus Saccharimonadaceae bacterium]
MDQFKPQVHTDSTNINDEASAARRVMDKVGNFVSDHSRKLVAVLAGATLALALGGCGTNARAEGPTPGTTPSAGASATPGETAPSSVDGVEKKFEEAQTEHEAFVASFSAEQKAVYDQLTPENLATMSDTQIQEIFAIPLTEVQDENGQIDPNKYAISVVIRSGANELAPCSDATFSKYGGAIKMTPDDITAEVTRYTNNSAIGLKGTNGTIDTGKMFRCSNIQAAIDLFSENIPKYNFVQSLVPNSVQYDAAKGNIAISVHSTDNFDAEKLAKHTHEDITPQLDSTETIYFNGLHVNDKGNVVPTPA